VPDTAILERVAAFLGPVLRQFQPGQRQHRGGVLFGIVCFRAAFENLAKGVVQRFPSISLQRHGTLADCVSLFDGAGQIPDPHGSGRAQQ